MPVGSPSSTGRPRQERPLSGSFVSRTGLSSAVRSVSMSYRKAIGRSYTNASSPSLLLTPPSSPMQSTLPFRQPMSASDALFMHEDLYAEVTVIQRATRVPIITQSEGNLREVVYHQGRPISSSGK